MRKHKRYWTTLELDFIKQTYLFMTAKEMGYFLNRTPELVQWQKQKLGLKKLEVFQIEKKKELLNYLKKDIHTIKLL